MTDIDVNTFMTTRDPALEEEDAKRRLQIAWACFENLLDECRKLNVTLDVKEDITNGDMLVRLAAVTQLSRKRLVIGKVVSRLAQEQKRF